MLLSDPRLEVDVEEENSSLNSSSERSHPGSPSSPNMVIDQCPESLSLEPLSSVRYIFTGKHAGSGGAGGTAGGDGITLVMSGSASAGTIIGPTISSAMVSTV